MKKKLARSAALIALVPAVLLAGCEMTENYLKIDRDNNLEVQDYRDALAPREIPSEQSASKDIPGFEDYVVDSAKDLKPMPLVTISVNENIPLKDVLYELAQQANYDIELDPRIRGAVIFSARNRPFDQVMERLSDMAGLRYKMEDSTVRVELDTPYSETYKVDYLPVVRKMTSSVQNDVTVSSASGGESGGESSTGSTFSVSGSSEFDFWKDLDANLKQIIDSNSPDNTLRTKRTPVVSVAPTADGEAVNPPPPPGGSGSAIASGADIPAQPTDTTPGSRVEVTSLTDEEEGADSTPDKGYTPSYTLNKQSGLVSVFSNQKTHKKVASYLAELKRASTAQVLIEAKVFEVTLNDEFAGGINWEALDLPLNEFSLSYTSASSSPMPALSPASAASLSFGFTGNDFSSVIDAVSRFGKVHALASPRLTVLNNQSAVLNVAENQTYFELDVESSQSDSGTLTSVDSTAKSVPEGVLVNVTPTIDLKDKEITMTVRPTISRIESFVNDPGVALAVAQLGLSGPTAASLQSQVPNVSVQEFDSVIKLRSGETAVMGGLMKDRGASEQNGVPVLSEAPLIGGLFRNQGDKNSKTELVVFLRATIVDNGTQTIHQTDRDLYRIFSQDRRPFPL